MMFGNVVSAISGVSSALNAYNNKKATKHIAKENRKIAEMQFEYNKEEISRAFDYNLKAVLREQANEKVGAINEAKAMLANINMNTGNLKNVDAESFEHDIKDKTSKDIADNMVFMLDTHKLALDELVNTRVAQTYNLGLNYENTLSSINQKENALNQKYIQQMVSGIVKATTSMASLFPMTDTAEETGNTSNYDLSFTEYDENVITKNLGKFGIEPYDPYKKNYGF